MNEQTSTRAAAKAYCFDYLDRNAAAVACLNDNIFYFAELGMQEFETAKLMTALLEEAGFTVERPEECEGTLREALEYDGPAIVEAVVDANEPPLPGNITVKQALHFAEALARGEKDRWEIIKTVAEDKIREVI